MDPLRGSWMDSTYEFFRSLFSRAAWTRKNRRPPDLVGTGSGHLYENHRVPRSSHKLQSPALPPFGLWLFLVTGHSSLVTAFELPSPPTSPFGKSWTPKNRGRRPPAAAIDYFRCKATAGSMSSDRQAGRPEGAQEEGSVMRGDRA
jgi:hypothetical protein